MKKILALIGMTAGGWMGWAVGALVSTFTAYLMSVIGTGIGLYAANRFSQRLLP